jgi:hypothetical protein
MKKVFIVVVLLSFFAPSLLFFFAFLRDQKDCREVNKTCLADYYQRGAFRQKMLQISYDVRRFALHSHSFGNVYFGKDGFLFYMPTSDGYPLADLLAVPLSREERTYWDTYFKHMGSEHNGFGVPKIFINPPNKSVVYQEFLGLAYLTHIHRQSAPFFEVERLATRNHKEDFYVGGTELLALLRSSHETTYYKTDTHWNIWGAYLTYQLTMQKLKKLGALSEELQVVSTDCIDSDTQHVQGDILLMLHSHMPEYDHQQEVVPVLRHQCRTSSAKFFDIYYTEYTNAQNKGTLLIIGDSYRNIIAPLFSEHFAKTIVVHNAFAHAYRAHFTSVDVVVEIEVERYLRKKVVNLN